MPHTRLLRADSAHRPLAGVFEGRRNDRRQRLLTLTDKGAALERRLFERQRETVMHAYREAGPVAVEGFRRVMRGLMGDQARAACDTLGTPDAPR